MEGGGAVRGATRKWAWSSYASRLDGGESLKLLCMHHLSQFQRKIYCKTMGFQASLLSLLVVIIRAIATSPSGGSGTITGISIVPSGDNVAGKNYSLKCTVNVTATNDQLVITWLNSTSDSEITSTTPRIWVYMSGITGSAGSYSSTLTFSPLRASDAGMLTCEAILGNVTDEEVENINIIVHSKYKNPKFPVYCV